MGQKNRQIRICICALNDISGVITIHTRQFWEAITLITQPQTNRNISDRYLSISIFLNSVGNVSNYKNCHVEKLILLQMLSFERIKSGSIHNPLWSTKSNYKNINRFSLIYDQ